MKYLLLLSTFVILFSCNESGKKQPEPLPDDKVTDTTSEVCTFGIDSVTLEREAAKGKDSIEAVSLAKGRGGKPKPDPVPPINPDNPDDLAVFYIEFGGDTVTGTMWNSPGDTIFCLPAGLDSVGMRLVVENVEEDFDSLWYVKVTTVKAVYLAAPANRRQKLIVTASTPFGVSAGQSMLNSFGTGNPNFVFTTYTVTRKKAKEAASHEFGHSLGLRHQDKCDGSYAMGIIMGNGYYVDKPWWFNSPCQKDMMLIDKKLKRR